MMRELEQKRKVRRTIYSVPSILVLLIITFVLVKGAWGVMSKERESSERLRELEERTVNLSLREQELKEDISRLETPEGVKEEIKERFNVTQEGEYVAVLVDEKKSASSTDKSTWPWYKRLWHDIVDPN